MIHNIEPIDVSAIYSSEHFDYLQPLPLFTAYFKEIPHFKIMRDIRCQSIINLIQTTYASQIKTSFLQTHHDRSKKEILHEVFYLLFEDLLVHVDIDRDYLKLYYRKTPTSTIDAFVAAALKHIKRADYRKPQMGIMINGSSGFKIRKIEINKPKISIDKNYNDDFKAVHQLIQKRLSLKNDKGIVLLHGKPGTGKTSYIRYLITSLKKEVIFVAANMAMHLTDPDLLSLLLDHQNAILVIEDAELIITDREKNANSPVSGILNISDGLLSDCLGIQIIFTFNTDITKIDSALLRKGRLIAKYEFKELAVDKAQKLSNQLGFNSTIHQPATLTAIYNQEEQSYEMSPVRNTIGFRN